MQLASPSDIPVQLGVGASSHQLMRIKCAPLCKSVHSDITGWFEIGRGEKIFTIEIGKYHRFRLDPSPPQIQLLTLTSTQLRIIILNSLLYGTHTWSILSDQKLANMSLLKSNSTLFWGIMLLFECVLPEFLKNISYSSSLLLLTKSFPILLRHHRL